MRSQNATSSLPVQPRVCGEQASISICCCSNDGSAPRVRGTAEPFYPELTAYRFSPACAGNRSRPSRSIRAPSVQPRVCGEQTSRGKASCAVSGSAPRVRGTGLRELGPLSPLRFSPACAGNRAPDGYTMSEPEVQPRVCGEQVIRQSKHPAVVGSAPRVRGTGHQPLPGVRAGRFSPACAGNSIGFTRSAPVNAVQPRVCGEQENRALRKQLEDGSAPRVRGTVLLSVTMSRNERFSPACAGNRFCSFY